MWNKFSKSPKFSFLPAKVNVFMNFGFSFVAACSHCWVAIPATASTKRLKQKFGSEFRFFGVCSTIGNLFSFDACVDMFCY